MKNALTEYRTGSWYEATARERIAGLLDTDSFKEFIEPTEREVSPHLHLFDLPEAFDDGVVVGRGTVKGKPVLVAAQEGRFMGGTFGEVHGAKLVGLAALRAGPSGCTARGAVAAGHGRRAFAGGQRG